MLTPFIYLLIVRQFGGGISPPTEEYILSVDFGGDSYDLALDDGTDVMQVDI